MNIGFVLPDHTANVGGTFIFCRKFIEDVVHLDSLQDQFVFFSPNHHYDAIFEKFKSVKHIRLVHLSCFNLKTALCDRIHKILSFALERIKIPHSPLYRAMKKEKIDYAIYVQFSSYTLEFPFTAIIWDVNFREFPAMPSWNAYFERVDRNFQTLLPRAFRIVNGAEEGKRRITTYYNVHPEVIRVIPMPTVCQEKFAAVCEKDLPDVAAKYGLEHPIVFYPAQFTDNKNHITLLKAVNYLKEQKHFYVSLVLSGTKQNDSSFEYISTQIEKQGLSDCVCKTGYLSDAEMAALYKQATVIAYCTCNGPDNLPPLEAMHLHCPVICARYPGAEDQLGDAALFFDTFDYKQLGEHILHVCNDENLRKTLIKRGAKLAAERNFNYAERILETAEEYRLFASMFREI